MNTSSHAVVTGASSGIGEAISRKLIDNAYRVTGIARDFSKCGIHDAGFNGLNMDFSAMDKLAGQLKELEKQLDPVDLLVLCAGKGLFGSLEEFSYAQIRELMDVNFTSQAYVVRTLLPAMKTRGNGQIIVIGSDASLSGSRKGSIYCASKFALRGFAQALRDECGRNNIRVTLINPGMVRSPFYDQLSFRHGEDKENFIEPNDVAEAVLMLAQSRPETVFDEINLSPMKKVVRSKDNGQGPK